MKKYFFPLFFCLSLFVTGCGKNKLSRDTTLSGDSLIIKLRPGESFVGFTTEWHYDKIWIAAKDSSGNTRIFEAADLTSGSEEMKIEVIETK